MSGRAVERITAGDVRVGDRIAETRGGVFQKVESLSPGGTSVYIAFPGGSRIRPRYVKRLWREVQS